LDHYPKKRHLRQYEFKLTVDIWREIKNGQKIAGTLAARGLEEHVQITLIFRESSFHVIYCVTLAFMYFF